MKIILGGGQVKINMNMHMDFYTLPFKWVSRIPIFMGIIPEPLPQTDNTQTPIKTITLIQTLSSN